MGCAPRHTEAGDRDQDCMYAASSLTGASVTFSFLFQLSTFLSPFGKLQTTPGEVLREPGCQRKPAPAMRPP